MRIRFNLNRSVTTDVLCGRQDLDTKFAR